MYENLQSCPISKGVVIKSDGNRISRLWRKSVYNKALILVTMEKPIPFRKVVKVAVQSNYAAFLTS